MVKFTKEFENGVTTNTLIFRDQKFKVTMKEREDGTIRSDEQCLEAQIKDAFDDIEFDEEDADLDLLAFSCDDEEVFETLEMLEQHE